MSETTQGEAKSGWRRRWPLIKKILTYVFFALVAGLLIGLAGWAVASSPAAMILRSIKESPRCCRRPGSAGPGPAARAARR